VIVTVQFDHQRGKWRFRIRDADNDLIEFDSDYKYTTDIDAHEAGKDAIDFDLHYRMMEAAK